MFPPKPFQAEARLYLKRTLSERQREHTDRHLVCELHAWLVVVLQHTHTSFSTWLRIVHCLSIFSALTIPSVITRGHASAPFGAALGEKSFRSSPQFDGLASDTFTHTHRRTFCVWCERLARRACDRKPRFQALALMLSQFVFILKIKIK
jgi:hypothetical protein